MSREESRATTTRSLSREPALLVAWWGVAGRPAVVGCGLISLLVALYRNPVELPATRSAGLLVDGLSLARPLRVGSLRGILRPAAWLHSVAASLLVSLTATVRVLPTATVLLTPGLARAVPLLVPLTGELTRLAGLSTLWERVAALATRCTLPGRLPLGSLARGSAPLLPTRLTALSLRSLLAATPARAALPLFVLRASLAAPSLGGVPIVLWPAALVGERPPFRALLGPGWLALVPVPTLALSTSISVLVAVSHSCEPELAALLTDRSGTRHHRHG